MSLRLLERKIESERKEIARLEAELLERKAFLNGLLEALKIYPKENSTDNQTEPTLRSGSDMAKARDFLESRGHPAHVSEIAVGIGRENTKPVRMSLSGSLSGYARKNDIFTRTGPNVFGLVSFEALPPTTNGAPPPNFGIEPTDEAEDDVNM